MPDRLVGVGDGPLEAQAAVREAPVDGLATLASPAQDACGEQREPHDEYPQNRDDDTHDRSPHLC